MLGRSVLIRSGLVSVLLLGCTPPAAVRVDPSDTVAYIGDAPHTLTAIVPDGIGPTVQWSLSGPGALSALQGPTTQYLPPTEQIPCPVAVNISATTGGGSSSAFLSLRPRLPREVNGLVITADSDADSISAFAWERSTGELFKGAYLAGSEPVAVAVDPWFRFVFVANFASDDVSVFQIALPGLAGVPGSPFATAQSPMSIATAPDGRFIYVAHGGDAGSYVSSLAVDPGAGTLSPVPGSPFLLPAPPQAVAMHPSGRFLITADGTTPTGSVSAYPVDPTTGIVSPDAGSTAGTIGTARALSVHPSGNLVLALGRGVIDVFRIDPNAGTLTHAALGYVNQDASAMALEATGRFVFLTAYEDNTVYSVSIDPESGALDRLDTPLPYAGINPISLAADPVGHLYAGSVGGDNGAAVFELAVDGGPGELRWVDCPVVRPAAAPVALVFASAPE